jgi:fucose permease
MAVLHPVFALTGVLHAVGGPLLPSLASHFHLNDSQSGLLFLLYFAGTSLGAILCRGNYARNLALGFLAMAACCVGVAVAGRPLLPLVFLLLGISVGVPMSAVSLFVGRNFTERCAPMLTFLNFSWSAGALAAPLLAARLLMHHSYRAAYLTLAVVAVGASVACWLLLTDTTEVVRGPRQSGSFNHLWLVIVFAFVVFLQGGVENTAVTWIPSYILRFAGSGVVLAAASSSLYWFGFMAARGFSSLLLLRAAPARVLRGAVSVALVASVLLVVVPSVGGRNVAIFMLGAALAPIYPLLIAELFARSRHTSDSRWVLATAAFGGSVLPWLAGWISARSGSLRMGILTMPAALLLIACILLALGRWRLVAAEK